jgi:S-adenosylmethionine decarboxylase
VLETLVDAIVTELSLVVVAPPVWHVFPGEAGITAMVLLGESHLTLHTFPEHGTLTMNLYSCRERPGWPFRERLESAVGASRVDVRVLRRGE